MKKWECQYGKGMTIDEFLIYQPANIEWAGKFPAHSPWKVYNWLKGEGCQQLVECASLLTYSDQRALDSFSS
ncbi:MAG: hypothetical protein ACTSPB_08525, partial [Candidatus Thorarchaeota archaeon]